MRDYRKKVSEKEPEYKAYVCNRYASGGKNACSSHYINQKVLTQIVMTDIRCKAMWAQNSRETLRTQLLAREQSASVERTKTLQAELTAIGKRLLELDKLIQSAYEDLLLRKRPVSRKVREMQCPCAGDGWQCAGSGIFHLRARRVPRGRYGRGLRSVLCTHAD